MFTGVCPELTSVGLLPIGLTNRTEGTEVQLECQEGYDVWPSDALVCGPRKNGVLEWNKLPICHSKTVDYRSELARNWREEVTCVENSNSITCDFKCSNDQFPKSLL